MRVISIVQNRISKPVKKLFIDINHGYVKLGFSRCMSSVFKGSGFGDRFEKNVHEIILEKLNNDYGYVLEKYKNYKFVCKYNPNAPVWICWLQGEDNAPKVVKKCIYSIKNSTKHPVVVLDESNIDKFCYVPNYIKKKYEEGIISKAQFSDIVRMILLADYGGLWIDATVFIPNDLPEEVFKYVFFTVKRKPVKNSGYISNYMWTSFINGCQKNCLVQLVNKDLFFEYWSKNDYLIDYLLVDYFMMLVYKYIPEAKKLIDELPYNNPEVESLQNIMNDAFDEEIYDALVSKSETNMFKISWRMNYRKKTIDGKDTFFYRFLKQKQVEKTEATIE